MPSIDPSTDLNPLPSDTTDAAPAPPWHFDHIFLSHGGCDALGALFQGVMGLRVGERPPFPFPGQWLYQGEQAFVHTVPEGGHAAQQGKVRLGHIAFRSDQRPGAVIARLRGQGLHFEVARVPESGMTQIFVPLPGGLVVELDLPPDAQTTPTHHYGAGTDADRQMLGGR